MVNVIAHFRVALSVLFKWKPSAKHSYGYKFYLHVKKNYLSTNGLKRRLRANGLLMYCNVIM